MTVALTQSDFRAHLKRYLDQVNDEDETVYVSGANHRTVAVISQDKLRWLEQALTAKEESLDYAIARDQLIKRQVLSDDATVLSNDEFWGQFN